MYGLFLNLNSIPRFPYPGALHGELQSFGNGSATVRIALKATKLCLREKNSRSRTLHHICSTVARMDMRI